MTMSFSLFRSGLKCPSAPQRDAPGSPILILPFSYYHPSHPRAPVVIPSRQLSVWFYLVCLWTSLFILNILPAELKPHDSKDFVCLILPDVAPAQGEACLTSMPANTGRMSQSMKKSIGWVEESEAALLGVTPLVTFSNFA